MTQSAAPPQMYVPPISPPTTPEAEAAKKRTEARARRYVTRRARDTDDLALLLDKLGLTEESHE